ncbi:DUF3667 domain-containing protein [Sphingomonas baiyangensis]|uniref:DUF3667 domain-containing protein n=1 Tax=Sphingomonas baiyangensis TaxID=2572576 RepID=A0A4U1L7L8_9SPHN|nr:DUF3667 domain-containing protein [Sphingomonas baiyangensis]TKD52911.1 DUF3667 domain-containing protein [Sphingomonas baiyangensis]
MDGNLDASGDIATGMLLARAVERQGGHGAHGDSPLCLNCGTALIGAHCHRCGQAGHVHRSLGAIWHDLLHGVLHFEGRLWTTLPMLATRPGELTRRYIDGERARFVSPMALFLFSVFTLFAVLSILGIAPPAEVGPSTDRMAAELTTQRDALTLARERAVREANDAQSAAAKAEATREIAEFDRDIAALNASLPVFRNRYARDMTFKTGWKRLDYGIQKAQDNPGLALYKLQANSYKFSWLLIPLSVPFVWIMFAWRREFRAYDHAVFVTYSIAFMSLLFIVLTLLGAIGVPMSVLGTIGMLIPPFHIYRQLRGAYRLRRRSALARATVLLLFSIHVIASLFLMLVVGLGLVG